MRAGNVAVLDRVVVNVIQVLLEVSLIPDRVFPEASLPHVTFAMAQSPKLIRWSIALSKFNIKIVHIQGSANIVADYLSRASV